MAKYINMNNQFNGVQFYMDEREADMLMSGTHINSLHYPTGMAWGEAPIPVITKRTFLFCIHCGRKYLLKEENITTPLMEMNCACGGELEFKEETE